MIRSKSCYQIIANESEFYAMKELNQNPISKKDAVTKTEFADRVGFRMEAAGLFDDEFLSKHPHNLNSPKQDKDSRRHTLGAVIRRIGLANFKFYRSHPKYPKRKMVSSHD